MLSELKIAQAHVNFSGIEGAGIAEVEVFNDWPLTRVVVFGSNPFVSEPKKNSRQRKLDNAENRSTILNRKVLE